MVNYVIVRGKLRDNQRDPSNVQVVATKSEEGEKLSLQDMDGEFLTVTVLKEELLAPGSEVSVPTLVSGSSRTIMRKERVFL